MMLDVMGSHIADCESELRALTSSFGHLFARPEPREIFHDVVEGLLSDLGKKNGWTLAERAGHAQPGRIQTFLCRGAWSAAALEGEVRDYVVENLGSSEAVLIVDDTQMIKKGVKSVGVAPQHCGATNQTENCQVAVMLTYATEAGHAFIGHRLYLPKRWCDDRARCAEAGVPDRVGFLTKPEQAVELVAEAWGAGVPFGWVAMDGGYGQHPRVRHWCRDRDLKYVMAVPCSLPLEELASSSAGQKPLKRPDDLLARVPEQNWERRSCGEGSKGQRFYDWAFFTVKVKDEAPADGFTHTLLLRRSIEDPNQVAYFLIHAPHATPVPMMIGVAGMRWKIEECNEQSKDLLGLDQYQVRTWTSWHHFVTICMFAHAFLAVSRARLVHAHTPPQPVIEHPEEPHQTGVDLGKDHQASKIEPPGLAPAGSR